MKRGLVHHSCGHQTPVPGADRQSDQPCSACRELACICDRITLKPCPIHDADDVPSWIDPATYVEPACDCDWHKAKTEICDKCGHWRDEHQHPCDNDPDGSYCEACLGNAAPLAFHTYVEEPEP